MTDPTQNFSGHGLNHCVFVINENVNIVPKVKGLNLYLMKLSLLWFEEPILNTMFKHITESYIEAEPVVSLIVFWVVIPAAIVVLQI